VSDKPSPREQGPGRRILGIDLGTTSSRIAYQEGIGKFKVIEFSDGRRQIPSVVAFLADGRVLVGQEARSQGAVDPENTFFSLKSLLGQPFEEASSETPNRLVRSPHGDAWCEVHGRAMAPSEILANVLRALREVAEAHLGETFSDVILTVPDWFGRTRYRALAEAGQRAGLTVKRLLHERSAVALACSFGREKDDTVAVLRMGGGSFGVSIMEVGDNMVQAVSACWALDGGGDDIDALVVGWLVAKFKQHTGVDVSGDKLALRRLKEVAEQAKIDLSFRSSVAIHLPFLAFGASGPVHLETSLTRAEFERLLEPLLDRCMASVSKALVDADKTPASIGQVLLVGGGARIPLVQQRAKAFFGQEPVRGINLDEVAVVGAAIRAGVLSGGVNDVVLLDNIGNSLSVATEDDKGSLGSAEAGGVVTVMVQRNTLFPTLKKKIFTTGSENQTSVAIHIMEGEDVDPRRNLLLGKLMLEGIKPAPRGEPQIEVTFHLDANERLWVIARDLASGKEEQIDLAWAG
jgi:molecular chaperone DnaK